jgi:heterodisulfide reductase subunit B
MPYALFRCCVTNRLFKEYETATDTVLHALDMPVEDLREFGCCGYPLRNVDYTASMYSAARNFALAGRAGMDMLTVCNCCFGTLRQAGRVLERDQELAANVSRELQKENLLPANQVRVRHLLEVLYNDVGPAALAAKTGAALEGTKVVMHYGCHLLRPSDVVDFDNPFDPVICEELVSAAGAECLEWDRRLDCCGAPLAGIFDDLSFSMSRQKLEAAARAGAHYLLCVCPFCHLQFERVRTEMLKKGQEVPPVLSMVQLLASALGREQYMVA